MVYLLFLSQNNAKIRKPLDYATLSFMDIVALYNEDVEINFIELN